MTGAIVWGTIESLVKNESGKPVFEDFIVENGEFMIRNEQGKVVVLREETTDIHSLGKEQYKIVTIVSYKPDHQTEELAMLEAANTLNNFNYKMETYLLEYVDQSFQELKVISSTIEWTDFENHDLGIAL